MGSSAIRLLWFLCAAIALAPLCLVHVPGLGDYLNHLARMHVLVNIGHSPALQLYYQVHWSPIPYLAMDAVVPLLARILPIYVAGKVFVIACVVLPVAGTACLHYVVHRRVSPVPLAAWLVSYNTLLSFGFLNYLFSLGFALFLFSGWVAAVEWPRWRRTAVFAPSVLALYFGHAFACGAYCLAVAGFESDRALRARLRPFRTVAANVLAALAQALPAIWFAATLNVGAGYVGRLQNVYGDIGSKLLALFSPVLFLHDAANGMVLLATLLCAGIFCFRVRLAPGIGAAFVPVLLAGIAMPHVLDSTWGMDLRLPLFGVLLLIGGASFPRAEAWLRPATAVLLVLLAAKSADAWSVLRHLDAQIADARRVLGHLPVGARLLVVNPAGHGTGRERVPESTFWHMPLTAVIDRDAFVPTLFNGLTTVRMQPAYHDSSTPNGLPVTPAQLREGEFAASPTPGSDLSDLEGGGGRIYWLGWPKNFDFVLVERFGADPGPLPAVLSPIAHSVDMDLYAVERPR